MLRWSFSRAHNSREILETREPLSSGETGVNPGMRSWQKARVWIRMSESYCWNLFLKEVKSWDSIQPGLELVNFKPRLKSGVFGCISRPRVCWFIFFVCFVFPFFGVVIAVSRMSMSGYIKAPNWPLNYSQTFFWHQIRCLIWLRPAIMTSSASAFGKLIAVSIRMSSY